MTQEYTKPLPTPDEDTKPFWEYCKQHELRMQKCLQCGKAHWPAGILCPHCHSLESEWVKLSGKGRVHSFLVVHRVYHPGFAKDVPYTVANIETEEGTRMISNVIGCKPEDVQIDMPVEVVFEDITEEFALPKFKPAA
ncbi:Zn-ribbon domain-containing OB-fold protein [Chloroflexota bacterium]